ncbi:hypothetical protein [Streptomyces alboniger]|uniref:Lipoprotein n=1 Tax=Streptomyces alboniger TaxID=132473 RepID=A0A5J6HL22_STRAD|nr:hypothetical protein [Streptomyces alboniger]QEV19912.1 hypothetical protein CP975_22475 [Streptomyces alboniger]
MSIRRAMLTRRALTAVAITTGLVLTVAGCGGGGDEKPTSEKKSSNTKTDGESKGRGQPQKPAEGSTLAEVKGESGLTLKVTSAKRDDGGFLTVEGTVTNGSGKAWVAASWRGDERELTKNGGSMAGASLVDAAGKKKYLILRDTQGRCLCTRFTGGVLSGQSVDWFAQFPAPPEGTTKVDFQVGAMPPAPIKISEGE